MVENPLAFEFSKTCTICDAFNETWAFLHGLGSDLTQAPKLLATQTILAKRIIEMADQGLRDIPELRDDALAFLQHSPPQLVAPGALAAAVLAFGRRGCHDHIGLRRCTEGLPTALRRALIDQRE